MNQLFKQAVLVAAFFVFAALAGTGCSSSDAPIDSDARSIAVVDGVQISVTWFEQTYINFLIQTGGNDTRENRQIHLENLIDGLLLAKEFESLRLDTTEKYQRVSARERKEVLGERFFDEGFLFTLPPPTEAELRESFVRSKDQVVVRHLFFFSENAADASYGRLQDGTPFLDEAQNVYQTTSFDSTAGFLGPIKFFGVDDAFATAAFALDAGEYSSPVRSRFGYHIIRVEDKLRQPLITESEYQAKKKGVSSQFRLRKRRLEGDRFVQAFMQEKAVVAMQPEITALNSLLQDFANTVEPRPTIVAPQENRFEVDSLRRNMNPETILATYEWNGEIQGFSAGEYISWLEALPFQEALTRTAASVGRAMRNELLARAGEEEGYEDAVADQLLQRELRLIRAQMMRDRLRADQTSAVSSELLERAVEAKGLNRRQQFRASFELATFSSRTQAENVASRLRNNIDPFSAVPGYERVEDQLLLEIPAIAQHIRNAPLDEIIVIGTASYWLVVRVSNLQTIDINSHEERLTIENQLRPLAKEYELVSHLRSQASIEVKEDLFERVYNIERLKRELDANQ